MLGELRDLRKHALHHCSLRRVLHEQRSVRLLVWHWHIGRVPMSACRLPIGLREEADGEYETLKAAIQ